MLTGNPEPPTGALRRDARRAAIVACVLATVMPAAAAALDYRLVLRADRPLVAELAVELPRARGRGDLKLRPRAANMGLAHQIGDVRCDRKPLAQEPAGTWIAPPGCRRVTWKLRFIRAEDLAVVASAQSSLYFAKPAWWLVSEPTALLRPEGMREAGTLALIGPQNSRAAGSVTAAGRRARLVPAGNQAPEYYALGAFPSQILHLDGMRVTYIVDDPARFSAIDVAGAHHRLLHYLAGVTGAEGARDNALTAVWLGIDASKGHLGGAAGRRTLLVNYPVGAGHDAAEDRLRTLMIVGHEQFHQLADMAHGNGRPAPLWIAEGLAQYYGLKAIGLIGEDEREVKALVSRFVDPEAAVETGLLETNRRYLATRDPGLYPKFYAAGATLWHELDRMLQRASAGAGGLDELLPLLLAGPFSASGELPAAFVDELRHRDAAETARILKKYVGE